MRRGQDQDPERQRQAPAAHVGLGPARGLERVPINPAFAGAGFFLKMPYRLVQSLVRPVLLFLPSGLDVNRSL